MRRSTLLKSIDRRLGNRALVWCGLRGDDAEPLSDLPQFAAAYSMIGNYDRRHSVEAVAYEDLSGVRRDMELWDIEGELASEHAQDFRAEVLRSLAGDSALLPYRSSRFLSSLWFSRMEHCIDLGRFGGLQTAFEHKPWVESSIAASGIPVVPWTYVVDPDELRFRSFNFDAGIVLRRSRTSGGEGFWLCDSIGDVARHWPSGDDALASLAPYLKGALPVNVGATVWANFITVHHPSVQLIGVPGCTDRPFGYVGNDFGATKDLGRPIIEQIEAATGVVGEWLRHHGFVGSFGIDFLVHEGTALFLEVNPRFQGSTLTSCMLDVEADEGCLMLEHVAAMLGIEGEASVPLWERTRTTPDRASVVVHRTRGTTDEPDVGMLVDALMSTSEFLAADVLTRPSLRTEQGGVVGRFTTKSRLTEDGFHITGSWLDIIHRWKDDPLSLSMTRTSSTKGGAQWPAN